MSIDDYRISKTRNYLFDVINTLTTNRNYQINANMLSSKIDDYSLDKSPTDPIVEEWIIGPTICRDVYSFRSRKTYSQDTLINLKNMGFFEEFEKVIRYNNENKILPQIDGIESIKCLNPFTMLYSDNGNVATFDIQIEITYRYDANEMAISL